MKNTDLLTVCLSTGTGKSLIIYAHILENLNTNNDVFAIASHRLMLNSQHLTDMFEEFKPLLGHIGFIFVGSDPYKEQLIDNKEYNRILMEQGLNFKDILLSTTSPNEIKDAIELHKQNNRNVVIVSTYHSLNKLASIDINTLYCDEAQTLA